MLLGRLVAALVPRGNVSRTQRLRHDLFNCDRVNKSISCGIVKNALLTSARFNPSCVNTFFMMLALSLQSALIIKPSRLLI